MSIHLRIIVRMLICWACASKLVRRRISDINMHTVRCSCNAVGNPITLFHLCTPVVSGQVDTLTVTNIANVLRGPAGAHVVYRYPDLSLCNWSGMHSSIVCGSTLELLTHTVPV